VRVLVVEDEPTVAGLLRRALVEEGYAVDVAGTGDAGYRYATAAAFDAIVLDVLLPGGSGFEVCARLRRGRVWTPVLMLTARDAVTDRVRGLDGGADDYLTKPFSLDELLARIRALTRRGAVPRPTVLCAGDLCLDPATRQVSRGPTAIHLTAKEFALLEAFLRHPGTVLTRRRAAAPLLGLRLRGRLQRGRRAHPLAPRQDRPTVPGDLRGDGTRRRVPVAPRRRPMKYRLPIRIRLTAVFAAVMTLALAGTGIGAVLDFGRSLDASLDARLTAQADRLTTPDGVAADDVVAQRIGTDGRVVATTRAGPVPLLDPAQVARARRHPLRLDRDHLPGVSGRARVLATAGDDDTVVVVATSLAGRDAALADIRTELAVAFPLVLLVATAAAYLLATAALRPVERMRAQAAAVTADTPGSRLPVPPGRDEITRLGTTLNDMLDRLHTALTRERDFVADASHELRTPLALLTTELELALRRPRSPTETEAALRNALADTHRLGALAEDLLLLARTDHGYRSAAVPVPLGPLLHGVADRYRGAAGGRTLRVDCPVELVAAVDPGQLERVAGNLVDNAIRHGGGDIDIAVRANGTHVSVLVHDHGPGFPAEFLPTAFDRFTRADAARTGPGTGLGLAIVAAIARRHFGTVAAANHPDGGAVVTVYLPG
jgi:DNA-binding response OmpR family regulator/signal transduction histidine kinase